MKKCMSNFIMALFLCFSLMACLPEGTQSSEQKEFKKKKASVGSLMAKQPGTTLDFSMDRYLLDERNIRFNDPNHMNYAYIFAGDQILEVTIRGKLASTSKRLTAPVQSYKIDRGANWGTALGPAPDMMGTYGHSSGGKVGMTTIGSLIEMTGFFICIYSEMPLNFTNLDKPIVKFTVEASPEEKKVLDKKLRDVARLAKTR